MECIILTPREKEVFDLVVAGMQNKAIAYRLGISVRTVDSYVSTILAKTGVRTRYKLATVFSGTIKTGRYLPGSKLGMFKFKDV